jgi:drug/metabolite transporter (DMT)-like permease
LPSGQTYRWLEAVAVPSEHRQRRAETQPKSAPAFTAVSLIWLNASETVIIAYTLPIWTALLARPLLLGERLTLARGFGMALGLSGVILLVLVQPEGSGGWTSLLGAAFALSGHGA